MIDELTTDCLCPHEEIAAYLDGELDLSAQAAFEAHVKACQVCAAQLEEQRELLCTLDFALHDEPCVELPKNFTKVIAAHAESDMSGVRQRSEHHLALRVSAVLILLSFALLGGAAFSETVFRPLALIARRVVILCEVGGRVLFDAGAGLTVISRAVGGHLLFESHPLLLLSFFLLAVALALLLRHLSHNWSRARIT